MTYVKTVWNDEMLAGVERYDILADGGTPISENVQINLSTLVTVAGSALTAVTMNNLETGVEAHDLALTSMRAAASQLTITAGVVTVTQSNHKLQPESGVTDDLETIAGTTAGQAGVFYCADYGTDTITIKHNTGNIICPGGSDVSLSNGAVNWYSDGTKVYLSGGGGGGSSAGGSVLEVQVFS